MTATENQIPWTFLDNDAPVIFCMHYRATDAKPAEGYPLFRSFETI